MKKEAKVTIELDEKWATNATDDEMREFLETYIDTMLGFRGTVKRIRIIEKE